MNRAIHRTALAFNLLLLVVGSGALATAGQATEAPPAPPSELTVADKPWDGGGTILLNWKASPTDGIKGYEIFAHQEVSASTAAQESATAAKDDLEGRTETTLEGEGVAPEDAGMEARETADSVAAAVRSPLPKWNSLGVVPPTQLTYAAGGLDKETPYRFMVVAIGSDGAVSVESNVTDPIVAKAQWFNGAKLPLFCILIVICGAVFLYVMLARAGMPMKIRTIAGLRAVDEAVGRATEMGRSILYINGIQDMDDLQTVAGVTVLGHVAKTAAEYDAKIEVPTSRSLVMTAAREAVQSSYYTAGRPDAYNPDLIYYVTDEQFGFVAYVSGMMTREKPAACFYMGAFFAESLILAETGNSVGAIQIAGTAQPSQLPFFVAACDYTLIGEEFFAASAYLSGQPDQLGSLKGQDVGKIIVGIFIIIGVVLITVQMLTADNPSMEGLHDGVRGAVDFLVNTILGS